MAAPASVEAYLAANPMATAEVEYTSRVLDMVHEGFDLAVRFGPMPESTLIARRLCAMPRYTVASPGYQVATCCGLSTLASRTSSAARAA